MFCFLICLQTFTPPPFIRLVFPHARTRARAHRLDSCLQTRPSAHARVPALAPDGRRRRRAAGSAAPSRRSETHTEPEPAGTLQNQQNPDQRRPLQNITATTSRLHKKNKHFLEVSINASHSFPPHFQSSLDPTVSSSKLHEPTGVRGTFCETQTDRNSKGLHHFGGIQE